MGAKRKAKKEFAKEQELAKLRAAEARKKAEKDRQRKAAAARTAERTAAHQKRLAAMSTQERAEYNKQQGRLGIAAVVVVALVMGGCIYAGATGDDDSDGEATSEAVDDASGQPSDAAPAVDQDDQEYAAFDICTEFVKDRLKSPGSASFRNYFEDDGEVDVAGSGLGPYTVTSTVDSENSFGAELRIPFVCTVSNPDGDDRWVLDDLQLVE